MKAVFLTFMATISAVAFATSLFFNSMLGMFGLTTVAVDKLSKLTAASQVLDTVKSRHKNKKLQTSKKFIKKASKKIASTAVAAATVGTVAVAVAMVKLEIDDYCEDKKQLQDDDNALYSTNIEFNLSQCITEANADSKVIYSEAKEAVRAAASKAVQVTVDATSEQLKRARNYMTDVFEFYDKSID